MQSLKMVSTQRSNNRQELIEYLIKMIKRKQERMEEEPQEEIKFERSVDERQADMLLVHSTKFKQPFCIRVARSNFPYYEVITVGGAATPIKGYFTSIDFAKKEVIAYINRSPISKTIRRDRMSEIMIQRKEKQRGHRLSEESNS